MTTFLLIRHAHNDFLGRGIAGRTPGVHLNDVGKRESDSLAASLAVQVDAIYSSPLERARETAEPLAARTGLPIQIAEELLEIDFGEWSGRSVEELRALDTWRVFNTFRSSVRIPGGETLVEVQSRMLGFIQRIAREMPGARVALFSHGDPLKTVLAYYLGMPLDFLMRLELSPASVSSLDLSEHGVRVAYINRTVKV